MISWNLYLLLAALTIVGLGGCGLGWSRGEENRRRTVWGRRLCVLSLVLLGAESIVAIVVRPEVVAPLGLLAGFLMVGMLWDSPAPDWQRGGQ